MGAMREREEIAKAEAIVTTLLDWADWMRGYEMGGGYPKRSAFLCSDASSTFDDLCDAADARKNKIVDTCIDDLIPAQKAAINRRYLSAVYRMRDYEGSLMAAHEALGVAFRKKGVLL